MTTDAVPLWHVPHARPAGDPAERESWREIPELAPFRPASGRGAVRQATVARLCQDGTRLHVRFDCEDTDAWATHARRDANLWEEEVVELFVAPGVETPETYFEIEVNPLGTLFDAIVHNPHGDRRDMVVDAAWDCAGLTWGASVDPAAGRWSAWLSIPWESLTGGGAVPGWWRANLYRIDRPRTGPAEFSCWSPTETDPADFHRPARMGTLLFSAPSGAGVRG